MPDQDATVVPVGSTLVIPGPDPVSNYTVYGTLIDSGSLSDAGINYPSQYPPSTGAPGQLDVEATGSATDVVLGENAVLNDRGVVSTVYVEQDASITVGFGGVLSGLSSGVQYSLFPPPNSTLMVQAGGLLRESSLDGGNATIDGTGSNITTLTAQNLTINGVVDGLTSSGALAYDEGRFVTQTTVNSGGVVTNANLEALTDMLVQPGGKATNVTLSGTYAVPGGVAQAMDNGSILTVARGGTADNVNETQFGITQVQQGGYATGITQQANSLLDVAGTAVNITVGATPPLYPNGNPYYAIFGIDGVVTDGLFSGYSVLPPDTFYGLAVRSGGVVGNVNDLGLVGIENGGSSVNTLVEGQQFVFDGGTAFDDLIQQSGLVYDSGSLLYNGSGSYVDSGQIDSIQLMDVSDTYPPNARMESFGTGNVVQAAVARWCWPERIPSQEA